MNFDVKFSKSGATFAADFNQVNEVTDGSYDDGFEAGKASMEEAIANKADREELEAYAKRKAPNPNFYTALGYTTSPEETTFLMASGATPNSIIYRDGSANFKVKDPTDPSHPAPRKYVDALIEKHNALEERVADLESLTLTYTEDKARAYEKAVPAEVGKYALVKEIGGASVKCNNLLDINNLVTCDGSFEIVNDSIIWTPSANGVDVFAFAYWLDVTPNTDYTISVALGSSMFSVYAYTNYIYGNRVTYNAFTVGANKYITLNSGDNTRLLFGFYSPKANRGSATTETIKDVMIVKGPTALPYEKHFKGFRHAAVDRLESIGANRFNQTLLNEYSAYFSVDEIGVTLKKSDGRAWANIPTSYTLEAGDYTIHAEKSDTCRIQVYSVEAESVIKETSKGIVTFTLSKKTSVKIKILAASGTSYPAFIGNVMFSNGTTAVPYKPYSAEPIDTFAIPVDAIKARVSGYGLDKNYIQWIDNKVEFVQKKKKVILNSKIGYWEKYVNNTTSGANVYLNAYLDNKKIGYQTSICNAFENKDVAFGSGVSGQYSDHPSLGNAYFCSDLATLAEWKAWLDAREASGNPVILEYDLATPIVTDITDLFTEDNALEVEGGGTVRFVNEHELPLPSNIAYVTRKG